MTLYDREDRIECDECDTWAEHEWHEKAEDFEGQLLAALSKLEERSNLQHRVYAWLGVCRDRMRNEDVAALQQILGPL